MLAAALPSSGKIPLQAAEFRAKIPAAGDHPYLDQALGITFGRRFDARYRGISRQCRGIFTAASA
jgi:hypothetical protein